MEKLDKITYDILMYAVRKQRTSWAFNDFRKFRLANSVTRETVIPNEFLLGMLEYRKLEYNPEDFGWIGKFSEVYERVGLAFDAGKSLLYNDFNARKAGQVDLKYGRKAVEKKTGAGDWLRSTRNHTVESIVKEYSKKTTLIHWENVKYGIDITCTWSELMEYLSHYKRTVKGPEMGASYWFKSYCKPTMDGDGWIVEIQNYSSGKKLEYIKACPFNK